MKTKNIYADPTVDFAFKRIFGTERFKAATVGLLNSVIKDVNIVDVTFLNTEVAPENKDDKKCVIDVLAADDQGNNFIVEMQNAKQAKVRKFGAKRPKGFGESFPHAPLGLSRSDWGLNMDRAGL